MGKILYRWKREHTWKAKYKTYSTDEPKEFILTDEQRQILSGCKWQQLKWGIAELGINEGQAAWELQLMGTGSMPGLWIYKA